MDNVVQLRPAIPVPEVKVEELERFHVEEMLGRFYILDRLYPAIRPDTDEALSSPSCCTAHAVCDTLNKDNKRTKKPNG